MSLLHEFITWVYYMSLLHEFIQRHIFRDTYTQEIESMHKLRQRFALLSSIYKIFKRWIISAIVPIQIYTKIFFAIRIDSIRYRIYPYRFFWKHKCIGDLSSAKSMQRRLTAINYSLRDLLSFLPRQWSLLVNKLTSRSALNAETHVW